MLNLQTTTAKLLRKHISRAHTNEVLINIYLLVDDVSLVKLILNEQYGNSTVQSKLYDAAKTKLQWFLYAGFVHTHR